MSLTAKLPPIHWFTNQLTADHRLLAPAVTILPQNSLPPSSTVHDAQIASFASLYTAYSPALLRALLSMVGEREWAEDLLHDTFLKVAASLDQYDADQGGLYTWLVTIARRVALDALRKRKVRLETAMYIWERSSDHTYLLISQDLSVERLSGLLPAKYGQVLALIYIQGLTKGEIAQTLGLPLGTVKTRCRVGLQKLQQVFRQDIDQYRMV